MFVRKIILLVLSFVCSSGLLDAMDQAAAAPPPKSVSDMALVDDQIEIFIFGEDERMTYGFYAGTLVILATIFVARFIVSKDKDSGEVGIAKCK